MTDEELNRLIDNYTDFENLLPSEVGEVLVALRDARDRIAELEREREEARAALGSLEWSAQSFVYGQWSACCPECEGTPISGHNPSCAVGKVLAAAKDQS